MDCVAPWAEQSSCLTDVEAEAYVTSFPHHLPLRHTSDPIPQMLGQP